MGYFNKSNWFEYNRGSVGHQKHFKTKRQISRVACCALTLFLLSVLSSQSVSPAYASVHMLHYIDEACLQELTQNRTDKSHLFGSNLCFATPDSAFAIEAEQQAEFSVLMDAIRSLQKALGMPGTSENRTRLTTLKNNLGHALILLGRLHSDETLLREGARLLREALDSIDDEQNSMLFALTQRNLASALMMLAAMLEDEDYVNEAVERYGAALNVFDEIEQEGLAASTKRRLETLLSYQMPSAIADHLADVVFEEGEGGMVDEDNSMSGSVPIDPDFELLVYGSVSFTAVAGRDDILNDGGSGYDIQFSADPEVNIAASYDTGMGFDYGADISIDVEDVRDSTSLVHFSGGFGELRFGEDSGAEDDMYIGGGDYQAGTGGIGGDAANVVDVSLTGTGDAVKVSYYTPREKGVQFGLSFTPDTVDAVGEMAVGDEGDDEGRFQDHVGLGVNWVANIWGADILAAAVGSFGQAVTGDDLSSYSLGGGVSLGPVQFGAGYTAETSFNDRKLLNFGVTRNFDPWLKDFGESNLGAGIAFLFPENEGNSTVLALSADIELATGLSLLGDIAYHHQKGRSSSNDPSNISGVLSIEMDY